MCCTLLFIHSVMVAKYGMLTLGFGLSLLNVLIRVVNSLLCRFVLMFNRGCLRMCKHD